MPTENRYELNKNLAQMLKGGVIMDVTTPEQAKIAEAAGAAAVSVFSSVCAGCASCAGAVPLLAVPLSPPRPQPASDAMTIAAVSMILSTLFFIVNLLALCI